MMSFPRLRDNRDFSPYSSSSEWAYYSFALPCELQHRFRHVLSGYCV
ncbi:hypothetical protein E2C01_026361 [Portunus trituberculatus]|uniref:Uncharacterized protein n=1 Tax=Portunus trituberculatus TaxID=210409 RepID=A0A5B7EIY7_PORTR|nr:hypothetical protein [Portunus trituberculatus]